MLTFLQIQLFFARGCVWSNDGRQLWFFTTFAFRLKIEKKFVKIMYSDFKLNIYMQNIE